MAYRLGAAPLKLLFGMAYRLGAAPLKLLFGMAYRLTLAVSLTTCRLPLAVTIKPSVEGTASDAQLSCETVNISTKMHPK